MARLDRRLDAATSGCYEASRAAALSGVPERTVYDWAKKGLVVPSVSPVQEKLWSYADLMSLRLVAWLRRPKDFPATERLPANPMSQVRQALGALAGLHIPLWSDASPEGSSPLVVDQRGAIFLQINGSYRDLKGNVALPHEERFGLLSPFQAGGLRGPDLRRPRPDLRITPARVAGEPHVAGTRITTQTLVALLDRGFSHQQVAEMYGVEAEIVSQAADLEYSLDAA